MYNLHLALVNYLYTKKKKKKGFDDAEVNEMEVETK